MVSSKQGRGSVSWGWRWPGPLLPGSHPLAHPAQWWIQNEELDQAWQQDQPLRSHPALALRGAVEDKPRQELVDDIPLGGDWDWNYGTKGVIRAANDKNGLSRHLACARPQSCSSSPTLLGSSPGPGSKGSDVRGFLTSGHQVEGVINPQ